MLVRPRPPLRAFQKPSKTAQVFVEMIEQNVWFLRFPRSSSRKLNASLESLRLQLFCIDLDDFFYQNS